MPWIGLILSCKKKNLLETPKINLTKVHKSKKALKHRTVRSANVPVCAYIYIYISPSASPKALGWSVHTLFQSISNAIIETGGGAMLEPFLVIQVVPIMRHLYVFIYQLSLQNAAFVTCSRLNTGVPT